MLSIPLKKPWSWDVRCTRSACLTVLLLTLAACGGNGSNDNGFGQAPTSTGNGNGGNTGGGNGGGTGGNAVTLSLLAGVASSGSVDGPRTTALFSYPTGVTSDSAGNFYVSESTMIRKITPTGIVTTLAGGSNVGNGGVDGTGSAASFNGPQAIAFDSVSGNLYVADTGNNTIRKVTSAGVVTTFAGVAGVYASAPVQGPQYNAANDGIGPNASFYNPSGITTDSYGNIYVVDANYGLIRKITPDGTVTTLAGGADMQSCGNRCWIRLVNGTGSAARFENPLGIVADAAGNLYVVDPGNLAIRMVTPAGVVTTYAGDAASGASIVATFVYPQGLTIDSSGNLYVFDNGEILMITPAGGVSTLAGTQSVYGSADGNGSAASFNGATGMTIDPISGDVIVADSGNSLIRKVTSAGFVTTWAGVATTGATDGAGSMARFFAPTGIATDASGNVYVSDQQNNTIRAITPAGVTTTLAGTAGVGGYVDGVGSAANFNYNFGVATDSAGNVYVADTGNAVIRKITPAGLVTTIAGIAFVTGADDTDVANGIVATFNQPQGIATDAAGNVYVSDIGNHNIRMITPAGIVTTLAGPTGVNAGVTGFADGTGAAATFYSPTALAIDSIGNIYVADLNNAIIRKITQSGVVTTIVGTAGTYDFIDGTGAAAAFNTPYGLAVDSNDNLYVADMGNNAIRKITQAGVVTTLAIQAGSSAGLPVQLNNPYGVALFGNRLYAISGNGIVYIDMP